MTWHYEAEMLVMHQSTQSSVSLLSDHLPVKKKYETPLKQYTTRINFMNEILTQKCIY